MTTAAFPSPAYLMARIGLGEPIIGFYDAPDPRPFEPLIVPGQADCVFAFYDHWLAGQTLHIRKEHFGCPAAAGWLFGTDPRREEGVARYLVEVEGLKESRDLMIKELLASPPYRASYPNILIGPIRPAQAAYARSITFFAEPDALSALVLGAGYHSAPDDPTPVIIPSGPGCMKLMPFQDPDLAQAAIGATDIGIRHFLPRNVLAFSVTRTMFERLCRLDEHSFLGKADLQRMKRSRSAPSS